MLLIYEVTLDTTLCPNLRSACKRWCVSGYMYIMGTPRGNWASPVVEDGGSLCQGKFSFLCQKILLCPPSQSVMQGYPCWICMFSIGSFFYKTASFVGQFITWYNASSWREEIGVTKIDNCAVLSVGEGVRHFFREIYDVSLGVENVYMFIHSLLHNSKLFSADPFLRTWSMQDCAVVFGILEAENEVLLNHALFDVTIFKLCVHFSRRVGPEEDRSHVCIKCRCHCRHFIIVCRHRRRPPNMTITVRLGCWILVFVHSWIRETLFSHTTFKKQHK